MLQKGDSMIVLIPMAGKGKRFADAGYTLPKPLIEVSNKPMIQIAVENLNIKGGYIFVVLKEQYERFHLNYMLNLIVKDCIIIQTNGITEGAACTTLLAKELIYVNEPLIIANCDQWIDWSSEHFLDFVTRKNCDGAILTFNSISPRHSYVQIDKSGYVTKTVEKIPVSNHACVGIYYWKSAMEYVNCAENMIQNNIRSNNEFYVAPVYNELIATGGKVLPYPVAEFRGMGTPEELHDFKARLK